jgi:hypothetical protein
MDGTITQFQTDTPPCLSIGVLARYGCVCRLKGIHKRDSAPEGGGAMRFWLVLTVAAVMFYIDHAAAQTWYWCDPFRAY